MQSKRKHIGSLAKNDKHASWIKFYAENRFLINGRLYYLPYVPWHDNLNDFKHWAPLVISLKKRIGLKNSKVKEIISLHFNEELQDDIISNLTDSKWVIKFFANQSSKRRFPLKVNQIHYNLIVTRKYQTQQ